VNEPLASNNLVLYQTDWDIVGLKVRLNDNKIFQLPLKKVTKSGNRFWLGSLNLETSIEKNLNIIVNDLTSKVLVYDAKGVLIKESFIGDAIKLNNNVKIEFFEFVTSTGLQIKSDPGIFVVYFSFLLLLLSIYISFFTYSQIWLVQLIQSLKVGGNSNRSVLFFQEEYRKILKKSINT
jgi:cytochrome c biogenesis protein